MRPQANLQTYLPLRCYACVLAIDLGGALGTSRLWFTIGGGVINEVYYPRVDIPQIRDLSFLVADECGFWVEVKRLWQYTVEVFAPGVPAIRVVHRKEERSRRRHENRDDDIPCHANLNRCADDPGSARSSGLPGDRSTVILLPVVIDIPQQELQTQRRLGW